VAVDAASGKLAKWRAVLSCFRSGALFGASAEKKHDAPHCTGGRRSGLRVRGFSRMDDHLKQLLLLGREHYEKGEHDKAEYLLRQLVNKSSSFADVYDMLGVIAHSRGDFIEAEKLFRRAVEINPSYTEAQLNLMVTCNELGKYDVARKIYSQVRHKSSAGPGRTDPYARGKIANMHAATSQAYQDAGMLPDAISELEKAVQLCPTFADLRTKLAQLYRDAGEDARAMSQLEAAKETNQKYVNARLQLGGLLLSQGDTARAIQEFEQVLQLNSKNQRAEMYLRLARTQRGLSEPAEGDSKAPSSQSNDSGG